MVNWTKTAASQGSRKKLEIHLVLFTAEPIEFSRDFRILLLSDRGVPLKNGVPESCLIITYNQLRE